MLPDEFKYILSSEAEEKREGFSELTISSITGAEISENQTTPWVTQTAQLNIP